MEGLSKTVVISGSMAWAMLLTLASATAAWAAIECTAASACRGTDGPNTMYGSTSQAGLTSFTVETDPTLGSTAATGVTW